MTPTKTVEQRNPYTNLKRGEQRTLNVELIPSVCNMCNNDTLSSNRPSLFLGIFSALTYNVSLTRIGGWFLDPNLAATRSPHGCQVIITQKKTIASK